MADNNYIERMNRLSKVLDRIPSRAAVVAVNFSKERFVRKNWVDRSRQKWDRRKRKDRGSLMVRTGRLKRSIRKIAVTRNHVIIGTDVPYARIHNEGGVIKKNVTVRKHRRKISRGRRKGQETDVKQHKRNMNITIPQRQFIGESAVLMRRIERMVEKEIKNALR